MIGEPRAGAGDAIANRITGDVPPDRHDLPHQRIAERDRRIELGENFLERRLQAFLANVRDHAAHEIGARGGFADQRGFRQLHELALGAGADQRYAGRDQQFPVARARRRHLGDLQLAASVILLNLLHEASADKT